MHIPERGNSVPSVTVTLFSRALDGVGTRPICCISAVVENYAVHIMHNNYLKSAHQSQELVPPGSREGCNAGHEQQRSRQSNPAEKQGEKNKQL